MHSYKTSLTRSARCNLVKFCIYNIDNCLMSTELLDPSHFLFMKFSSETKFGSLSVSHHIAVCQEGKPGFGKKAEQE